MYSKVVLVISNHLDLSKQDNKLHNELTIVFTKYYNNFQAE